MSIRKAGSVAFPGAVLLLAFAGWMWRRWGGDAVTTAADDIGSLAFALFATVCWLRTARRSAGRHRDSWLALAAGLAAWSAGEALWSYYEVGLGRENPFPSLADAGYLLFPVFAALALVLFPRDHPDRARGRLFLDGIIVAVSLFVVSWMTTLGAVYRSGSNSRFAFGVSLAYPVTDIVLLTMTVLILAKVGHAQRRTVGLLGAGMTLMAFSDSAFTYLTATGRYGTVNPVDIGWPAAFLLFGLAALGSRQQPIDSTQEPPAPRRAQLWLPYLPLLFAGAVGPRRSCSSAWQRWAAGSSRSTARRSHLRRAGRNCGCPTYRCCSPEQLACPGFCQGCMPVRCRRRRCRWSSWSWSASSSPWPTTGGS